LPEPAQVSISDKHLVIPPLGKETMEFRAAHAKYRWPGVTVDVVSSQAPETRRTNTPDQLAAWNARVKPTAGSRALLLTTQIYAPFQQMEALRLLTLQTGYHIRVSGVDSTNAHLPLTNFGPDSYLQETRSALLSATQLLNALARRR
jgi:hypothetical protein